VAVVATAGHVDHGKSTLVRALTGTDPDRLAEERRRGLTIELGYAWTDLPGVGRVAFVDVPGHERFLATMLAGVGPVPAVLLVVAADEGWRRQTGEHVAALDALGVRHGLVAVTRSDLADPGPATAQVTERLAATTLAGSPAVAVSGTTGAGLDELRTALATLVRSLPALPGSHRTRVFLDRVFTVRGSGTVVTGTLPTGSLTVGDAVTVGAAGRRVSIRALETCEERVETVDAVARVAVNLRGVERADLRRGDPMLTPDAWHLTGEVDVEVRIPAGRDRATGPQDMHGTDGGPALPAELVLHVGSAHRTARVRVLAGSAGRFARLRFDPPLPLEPGDLGVLRDPGRHAVAAGITVRDVDPPPISVRGSARARSVELADLAPGDLRSALHHRRFATRADLARRGVPVPSALPAGVVDLGGWLGDAGGWAEAVGRVRAAVAAGRAADPVTPGLVEQVAVAACGLPDPALVVPLAAAAGLDRRSGRLLAPGDTGGGVPARLHDAARELTGMLTREPFAAPDAETLVALGLAGRDLAVLASAGVIVRLPGDVVLLPDATDRAARVLAGLDQPFTLSAARQALGTSRRVAVPLLERLDAERVTVRGDGGLRRLSGRHPAHRATEEVTIW